MSDNNLPWIVKRATPAEGRDGWWLNLGAENVGWINGPKENSHRVAFISGALNAERLSRVQAPSEVENREASTGDVPKQGSGPRRDLRDAAIIARVLAVVSEECDRQKVASDKAQEDIRLADMYRHNTALHALWAVAAKIGAISKEGGTA